MRNRLQVMLCLLVGQISIALAEGSAPKASASDPTASINFSDFRVQAFDLDDFSSAGDERTRYALEGAYVLAPGHKLTYEVNYWETDVTGSDESGMESLRSKYINLSPGQLSGGIKYVVAVGVEAIVDLGEPEDGVGAGADQIAPLVGVGWNLGEKDFVITLLQYFHSYDEDDAAPQKVRTTGPRLIWIHKIPNYKAWLKIDNKFSIDHESGGDSSNILEVQLGKMLTPKFGVYVDYLNNTGGTKVYKDGLGIGLRVMY